MPGSARPGASRPHAPTRWRMRCGLDGSDQALASRSTACCRRLTSSALRPRVLQPRTWLASGLVRVRVGSGSGSGWLGLGLGLVRVGSAWSGLGLELGLGLG